MYFSFNRPQWWGHKEGGCQVGQTVESSALGHSLGSGFAGSAADAFSLSNKFEELLQKFSGNLMRSAVELAIGFREDKYARRLDALLLVADKDNLLYVSGNGDVFEPEYGVAAIGSGEFYALAASRALIENTNLSAKEIALKALKITSDICVFTNGHVTVEEV